MSKLNARNGIAAGRCTKDTTIIPFPHNYRHAYENLNITEEEAEFRLAISQSVRTLRRMQDLSMNEFIVADWLLIPTVYGRYHWIASTNLALNGDEWLPPMQIGRTSYFAALRSLEKKGLISRRRLSSRVFINLHIDKGAALTCFRMWQKMAAGESE